MAKSTIRQILFLLIITGSGRLAGFRWSVCISKSQSKFSVSFSGTNSILGIYYFIEWSISCTIPGGTPCPTQSCLVLNCFWTGLLHSLIMWFIIIILLESFSHRCYLMVWRPADLSCQSDTDSKGQQVSRTLLNIMTDLNNVIVWMFLAPHLISNPPVLLPSLWEPSQANQSHLISLSPSYSIAFLILWQNPFIITPWEFFTPALADGFSLDFEYSKSLQVSRTLLSIVANLNKAAFWIVSTRPLTSKSINPFCSPLVISTRTMHQSKTPSLSRLFDQDGHPDSSPPSLYSRPCSLWLLLIP